jgi:hypothetical protein
MALEQVEQGLHVEFEFLPDHPQWEGHVAEFRLVIAQRLVEVAEHSPEIADAALLLHLVVGPVHPCDGLQERVILQPLVQIHRLHNRGIKPREQHVAHNDDLGPPPALFLLVLVFGFVRGGLLEFPDRLRSVLVSEVNLLHEFRVALRVFGKDGEAGSRAE